MLPRHSRVMASYLLVVLLVPALALAQSIGGSISGQVVDQSGGAVVGATVRIVNSNTGQSRSVGTGNDGRYEARELPPGRYEVTVENPGFKIVVLENVNIGVGQNARLQTITVEPVPVEVTETVKADAQIALVESSSPTLSTSFNEKQIRELPILSRDLNNLALLAPGVFSVRAFSFASTLVPFAANGSRGRDNNFIIDAVDNNEPLFGGAATQFTNADLFAEYRILTNQFKAEYGRNSGSVVNIVTERGGNRWHGTLFWFGQHDNFNASNSVERQAQLKSTTLFYENQIGGTLGGPIKKESSWVFMSYQWDRARQDLSPIYPHVATLPTPAGLAELSGNPEFNVSPTVQHLLRNPSVTQVPAMTAPCGSANSGLPPTNPCSISAFQQNPFTMMLMASRGVPVFDANAANLFTPVEFGTYLAPRASVFDVRDHQGSARWDQRLGNRDDIYMRYLFDDLATPVTGGSFPGEIAFSDLGLLPDYRTFFQQRTQNLGLYWTRAWPRALHELRGSYTRISSTTGALGVERTLRETIPAVTVDTRGAFFGSLTPLATDVAPGGTVQGTANLLNSFQAAGRTFTLGRDSRPRLVNTNIFQIQDNVSISRGRNSIKFGVNIVRTQSNIRETPSDLGQYIYPSLNDFVYDFPLFAFRRFPNYLGKGGDTLPLREFAYFLFFQDDIQVSSNFVLNLGLRYESYGQVINSVQEKNPLFGPSIGSDHNNFAPRIGFAWSPRSSTVIRGGFGFFYNPTPFVIPLLMYQSGPISPVISLFFPGTSFPDEPFVESNLQLMFPTIDCTISFTSQFGFAPNALFNPIDCSAQDSVSRKLRQPYTMTGSLSWQQQLGRNWLLETSYVGTRGVKLYQRLDRNPQLGWDILPGTTFPDSGVTSFGCVQLFLNLDTACHLPRVDPSRGGIAEIINGASSTYHAGQIMLIRRLNRPTGLAMTLSYTWSHMIDNASEIFGPNVRAVNLNRLISGTGSAISIVEAITPFPQNPDDSGPGERGNSSFDRRHRLAASFLWALGSPESRGARFFFGNWQVNGFVTVQSGQPFSPLNGSLSCSDAAGDGLPTNDRPDVGSRSAPKGTVALLNNRLCLDPRDANPAGTPAEQQIAALITANTITPTGTPLDPNNGGYVDASGAIIGRDSARFVQVGLNHFGDAGRNILVGPRLVNVDLAVFKNFPFGESKNIQFRVEAYNLFNHANPGNPVGNVFTTNAQPVPALAFDPSIATPSRVTGTIPENAIDAFQFNQTTMANESLFLSRRFMNTSARRFQFAIRYIF